MNTTISINSQEAVQSYASAPQLPLIVAHWLMDLSNVLFLYQGG